MKTRIISGAVLTVIALATGLLGGPVLLFTLMFCTIVGMRELYLATGVMEKGKPISPIAWTSFAVAVIYDLTMLFAPAEYLLPVAAICMMLILASYVLTFPKYTSEQAITAVFGFFYLAIMLGFMYLTRMEPNNGILTVWLIYISAWGADTAAYFVGRFLGKHKMAPVLSPKKTVEGAIGGIVGAGLFGILFNLVFDHQGAVWQFFVICACGAVISIFGDLTASAIKRDRGIKDYGNLIPGHGGILDRFDSVIFTAPVIYFLSLLLIK